MWRLFLPCSSGSPLNFQTDSNDLRKGILQQNPDIDIVRVQDVGLLSADDPTILEWPAQEQRVLLTHDVQTMTDYTYQRVKAGLPMPGVFEVNQYAPMGETIEDVLILAECSYEGEWENQVQYLPLR
jgi:Domain of unknown function (DUF5615)